jgi:ech hydrogenase subunit A
MVAPTPVSALLHSSTMVKAGVFVVLRFAPAFAGTFLSTGVAVCGAFTFLACAALGIGQSNGKKILAYSTVANLGLIICCAGINTPLALTAAIILILFHAISKSLLFLCVGTIEQSIGSRDIEDMRGLYGSNPRTALITIIGILTMMLPPFGVLLGKWMAMEASADSNIFIVVMLALGSAMMVVYLARWAGSMMGTREPGAKAESQPLLTRLPLMTLCLGAVVLSLASPWIYNSMLAPWIGSAPFVVGFGSLESAHGTFVVVPLFLALGLGLLYAVKAASGYRRVKIMPPYVSGANSASGDGAYVGPMNGDVPFSTGNLYLGEMFAEPKLTPIFNALAVALIVLMLGGAL